MDTRKTNVREMKIDQGSGEKQSFSNQARPTAAWKSKNEVTEYSTPNCPKGGGGMGGKNTDS